jgi:hypothetical protein
LNDPSGDDFVIFASQKRFNYARYGSIVWFRAAPSKGRLIRCTVAIVRSELRLCDSAKSRSVIASKDAVFGNTFSSRPRSNAERSGAGYLRWWAIPPMTLRG